jgi:hypothetical protein
LSFDVLARSTLLRDWDWSTMPVESESLASFPSIRLPVEFLSEMPPLLPLTSFPRTMLSFAR